MSKADNPKLDLDDQSRLAAVKYNRQGPSRAGDRYHYLRAARLCLTMLAPAASLQRVVVEGSAPEDLAVGGEDVIDLTLYFGSFDPAKAQRIAYRQFKHSTAAADQPMTASDVLPTLRGYAERFASIIEYQSLGDEPARYSFEFETNRPIARAVTDAIENLATGRACKVSEYLRRNLPLSGTDLSAFASRIRFMPGTPAIDGQRRLLELDANAYLPDDDKDVPLRLVDLVAEKAATTDRDRLSIVREDVLKQMRCSEGQLLPAPSLIEPPSPSVVRLALGEIGTRVASANAPLILEAEGGIGKSVAAMELHRYLPEGSVCIVYDCFGNGSYRDPAQPRHKARRAFVQMANELAFRGLCDPLVPSSSAPSDAYARAFVARTRQAASSLADRPGAVLAIIVDAADNAEMAAEDAREERSFAPGMLRTPWPDRVRVLLTTRPERRHLLDPPPGVERLTLPPFSLEETASHLRATYQEASDNAVAAFHHRTSANPRLQRYALQDGGSLGQVLDKLGPQPLTVQAAIESLLNRAFESVRDGATRSGRDHLDVVCQALAVLRPFVPMNVVAGVARVDVGFVRSLASELGRALLVNDDAVQFADEPTETWFRERFRPSPDVAHEIADRLRPLARQSAYAAATLPRLLLEAGRLDELVSLALSDEGLPEGNDIGRRDVESERLRSATRAALRAGRLADAAKLAFRAAGKTSAEERQFTLLSANPDLAARFLEPQQVSELVANRRIGGGHWLGSENAHEAALMSGHERLRGEAVIRAAAAERWLLHHIANPDREGWARGSVDDEITAIAWAHLNLRGADACAAFLRSWHPRTVSFTIGRRIASRLIDAGRLQDLEKLALSAGNDIFLGASIALELATVARMPPREATQRLVRLLLDPRVKLGQHEEELGGQGLEQPRVASVVAIVTAALRWRCASRRALASLLTRYLPKYAKHYLTGDWASRYGARDALLRGYALRTAIRGSTLTLDRLVEPKMRKPLREGYGGDRDVRTLKEEVAGLLPWYQLWADVLLGRNVGLYLTDAIDKAAAATAKTVGNSYRELDDAGDERAILRSEILFMGQLGRQSWGSAADWLNLKGRQILRVSTVARIARTLGARTDLQGLALDLVSSVARQVEGWREVAEAAAETRLSLGRAVLAISEAEARAHFDKAVEIADRLGEENLDRWRAMLAMAEAAGRGDLDRPDLAYRLSRFAELTHEHLGKSSYLDWERTAKAIVALSASSGLAITSRWADRGFGVADDELTVILNDLQRRKKIHGVTKLVMFPAHGRGSPADLLEEALTEGGSEGVPAAVVDIFHRYVRFEDARSEQWRKVRKLTEERGLTWDWLNEREWAAARNEASCSSSGSMARPPRSEPRWDELLRGVELTSAGIDSARVRVREAGADYAGRSKFWPELFARVPAGTEADALNAIRDLSTLEMYDLLGVLEAVPAPWFTRVSVPGALRSLVVAVCRRQPFRVPLAGSWWERDLGGIAQVAGLEASDLARETLGAIGQLDDLGGAGELFYIANLVCQALTDAQAEDLLNFALNEVEGLLEPGDGDGPWHEGLKPPRDVEGALAGYLWSMLGSPDARRRWRGAHAVRCAVRWLDGRFLRHLLAYAEEGAAEPFQDQRLPFYRLHALQWLLFALDREACERPHSLLPAVPFLSQMAVPDMAHVILRGMAARILLRLDDAGTISHDTVERRRLRDINGEQTRQSPRPELESVAEDPDRLGPPYFDYGHRDDLLRPLASAFELSEDESERRVKPIMRELAGAGADVSQDPRGRLGLFRDQGYRRGRSTVLDTWSAYLSYHSVMVLCGRLLDGAQYSRTRDRYWSPSRFLESEGLSDEQACRWHADRRDSIPLECRLQAAVSDSEWPQSVDDVDVSSFARSGQRIALWGRWTAGQARLRQMVSVSTALVNRSGSDALVRALRSFKNPDDYALPEHRGSWEIGVINHVLKGWFEEREASTDWDDKDPWAADLPRQDLAPADWVTHRLQLAPRDYGRTWLGKHPDVRLRVEAWSEGERYEDREVDRGTRVTADEAFIEELVQRTGMLLVRKISVERRVANHQGNWKPEQRRRRATINLLGHLDA
ncbi:hypothetical protein [Rubellimicrobium aerolatum]|uniref:ATP-binding protein n=1 Tax=Rubellimicrobium aerolatum TaxID=490979 RepID=A0ABW0SGY1_9RHOB|nr:hypothetical protein [Rubellimicrobium aerolatum]MBP1807654.1 hypothetical protein [Rubellimicrobium aerolatum]